MSVQSDGEYESREAELLGVKKLPYRDHHPTINVLRLISGLALIALSVPGLVILLFAISTFSDNGIYLVLIGLALVVQGLTIYGFFGALALVVEDVFAIRKTLSESASKEE